MSIVQITNVGSTPVTFNGNERITLAPGAARLVPWEFATAWLGDPNLNPADRIYAYSQTRLLWGYSAGLDTDEAFEADKRPKVEVHSTDVTGEDGKPQRLYMLLDDPEGKLAGGAPSDGDLALDADVNLLRQQLRDQQERMARLEAALIARTDVAVDPSTATALATAATTAGAVAGAELPAAVPTPDGASDAPRASRVRRPTADA
jgi:hypothetical protein